MSTLLPEPLRVVGGCMWAGLRGGCWNLALVTGDGDWSSLAVMVTRSAAEGMGLPDSLGSALCSHYIPSMLLFFFFLSSFHVQHGAQYWQNSHHLEVETN